MIYMWTFYQLSLGKYIAVYYEITLTKYSKQVINQTLNSCYLKGKKHQGTFSTMQSEV